MLSLDKTTENTFYKVENIALPTAILNRFEELGLIKGTRVRRVLTAPSGDPAAYMVRGAQIAIRNEYAKGITVSECIP